MVCVGNALRRNHDTATSLLVVLANVMSFAASNHDVFAQHTNNRDQHPLATFDFQKQCVVEGSCLQGVAHLWWCNFHCRFQNTMWWHPVSITCFLMIIFNLLNGFLRCGSSITRKKSPVPTCFCATVLRILSGCPDLQNSRHKHRKTITTMMLCRHKHFQKTIFWSTI